MVEKAIELTEYPTPVEQLNVENIIISDSGLFAKRRIRFDLHCEHEGRCLVSIHCFSIKVDCQHKHPSYIIKLL